MIPFPDKKYKIIYTDVPIAYNVHVDDNNGTRNANHFYPTMTVEELKALPVTTIAEKNSVLLFWISGPTFPEGEEIIKAWGFEYKTIAFVWAKTYESGKIWLGMGHHTRASCEYVLLATRGKGLQRQDNSVKQLVVAPVQEHSKKPDEVRRRIVKLYGDLPRIELFAREKAWKWDAWGNEVQELPTIEAYSL